MRDGPTLLPAPRKLKKRPYRGNDPFRVLGVSVHAPRREIDRAYRRLDRQYHPDVNPSPDVYFMFRLINDAYAFITQNPDLAKLRFKCEVAQYKREYADFPFGVKRMVNLAGIWPEQPLGSLLGTDTDKQRAKLLAYLVFSRPRCKWQEECDRLTGFDQVKDIHYELVRRARERHRMG